MDEEDCWHCDGEGVVYSCVDGSCEYPEEGCLDCARTCAICGGDGSLPKEPPNG